MLNRSASQAMSTSVLKALPGKLDTKRYSPSILYILCLGIPGEEGDEGEIGEAGLDGIQGPQGPLGHEGPQGYPGVPGMKGDLGDEGAQGPEGDQVGINCYLNIMASPVYPYIPLIAAIASLCHSI